MGAHANAGGLIGDIADVLQGSELGRCERLKRLLLGRLVLRGGRRVEE